MTTQYVIRRVDFEYNDEYFQTDSACLGDLTQIYDNADEAEAACRKLVVEALSEHALEIYDFGYGEANPAAYAAVEALVLAKTGQPYDKDDGIPPLDEDGLFEFAQLTGIVHYRVMAFDHTQKLYVIWIHEQQDYFRAYDTDAIVSGNHANFIEYDEQSWYFLDQLPTCFKGTLEQLSDAPQLLQQVLSQHQGIHYDSAKAELQIKAQHVGLQVIQEINALLKQPLFEVQAKTLREFQAL